MRRRLGGLVGSLALLALVLWGGAVLAQPPTAPGAGGAHPRAVGARRGMVLNGVALKGEEFHVLTLRPFVGRRGAPAGPIEPGPSALLGVGKVEGILLFGTSIYGVVLELQGGGKVKGTIIAIERPGRKGRAAGPAGLAEAVRRGRKVGTLELHVRPYEGRLVGTGTAKLAEGQYKGSWKVILFTRPLVRALGRPGRRGT